MATHSELKIITKRRLRTVDILISAKDWDMAAYMMGYTLECALKATICKTLRLAKYPEDKSKDIKTFFLTHSFDRLLIASGMEDVFSDRGPSTSWFHWGQFVTEYAGEWTHMRYDMHPWDESRIKTLYTHLIDTDHGILTDIRKRW